MLPWILLAEAKLPDNNGIMTLHQRGNDQVIRVNNIELMSTRTHGSEDALGERGCQPIASRPNAQVLVGGLGMGFTLAAALKTLQADASVTVAELVSTVAEWNQGSLGDAAGRPLDDPRTILHIGDVLDVIKRSNASWDAILLDVDNGPEGLTKPNNDALYGTKGLGIIEAALKPGGILGVWSASEAPEFTRRLEKNGFSAKTSPAYAHGERGRRHLIWIATRK